MQKTKFRKKVKKIEQKICEKFVKEEHLLFRRMRYLKKHHQAWFALIISLGLIFVWRGLWNLIDHYWFPDQLFWSNASGVVVGVIVLYLAHKLLNLLTGD